MNDLIKYAKEITCSFLTSAQGVFYVRGFITIACELMRNS